MIATFKKASNTHGESSCNVPASFDPSQKLVTSWVGTFVLTLFGIIVTVAAVVVPTLVVVGVVTHFVCYVRFGAI